jgi:hypothetical protein
VGDAITARSRPTLDKQRIFDSPEGISSDALECAQLRRPTLQGGPAEQLSTDQGPKVDQLTNSPPTNSPKATPGRETHSRLT